MRRTLYRHLTGKHYPFSAKYAPDLWPDSRYPLSKVPYPVENEGCQALSPEKRQKIIPIATCSIINKEYVSQLPRTMDTKQRLGIILTLYYRLYHAKNWEYSPCSWIKTNPWETKIFTRQRRLFASKKQRWNKTVCQCAIWQMPLKWQDMGDGLRHIITSFRHKSCSFPYNTSTKNGTFPYLFGRDKTTADDNLATIIMLSRSIHCFTAQNHSLPALFQEK